MTSRVFVLNCGSSSVKYRLVDLGARTAVASGLIERIGNPAARLVHEGEAIEVSIAGHEAALRAVLAAFERSGPPLEDAGLVAVAHRVVHGGDRFADPVMVDDEVVTEIRRLGTLAPLHNPVNAEGIEVARRVFPDVPHVAVFDTAFHQTLPAHAYTYAVPQGWAREHGVRRYGFHGTSHAYVSRAAAAVLGRAPSEVNLIVLHLGNGASATAVEQGRSVDTSMGLTPLEGLVMGTRSGDLDPAIIFHLLRSGLSPADIEDGLNKGGGMLALAGDNDLREVHRRADRGDAAAARAVEIYCYRIRKYVGAYLAALGRVDAVVFTAGVGEHDEIVRERSLAGLQGLGVVVDAERNRAASTEARVVSPDGAEVAVLVVPTDEELEMAIQAAGVITGRARGTDARPPAGGRKSGRR
jgi:acetate kinase